MSPGTRAIMRRAGPWVALAAVVVVLTALIPVGRTLWATTLSVSGEVATGEFGAEAVLEFADVGFACEAEPVAVAVVANRGEADLDAATDLEFWFGTATGTGYDTLVGTQSIPMLGSGASVDVVEALSAGDGRYAFKLSPPGGGGDEAVWSNEIAFIAEQCSAAKESVELPPAPVATTTTVPPETTSTTTTTTVPPETTSTTTTTTVPPETTTTTAAPTTSTTSTTTTTAAPTTTTTSTTVAPTTSTTSSTSTTTTVP